MPFANNIEEFCTIVGSVVTPTGVTPESILFSEKYVNADLLPYVIEDSDTGKMVGGIGTYNTGGTITRADTWSWDGVTYLDSPGVDLSLTGGTYIIRVAPSAANMDEWDSAYDYSQVGHLPLTGGTISSTLIIGTGAADSFVFNSSDAGQNAGMAMATGAAIRWIAGKDTDAEAGANVGSNYQISRFDDAGAFIDSPMRIDRENGNVIFTGTVTGSNLNISTWDTAASWGNHTSGGYELAANKGATNGYAELVGGVVPSAQLPAYVDDVLSYANQAAFPGTGEAGKIYIAEDTNLTFRWSGSAYAEISASLALGETSATAYRGDRGVLGYNYSQVGHLPLTGGTLTGSLTATSDTSSLYVYSTTNGVGASVEFSDQNSRAQKGLIKYFHSDAASFGSGNAFVFDSTEPTTSIVLGSALTTASLIPGVDNTGVVGNATYTWSNGQFTNLTIDGQLTSGTGVFSGDVTLTDGKLTVDVGASGNVATFDSAHASGGYVSFLTSGTYYADIGTEKQVLNTGTTTNFALGGRTGHDTLLMSHSALALTLDSSQNATFAGDVTLSAGYLDITDPSYLLLNLTRETTTGNVDIQFNDPTNTRFLGMTAAGSLGWGTTADLGSSAAFLVTGAGYLKAEALETNTGLLTSTTSLYLRPAGTGTNKVTFNLNDVTLSSGYNIIGNDTEISGVTNITTTGLIDTHRADSERVFQSGNASASNADQFYIDHNFADVTIGNARGSINFATIPTIQGNSVWHDGNFVAGTDYVGVSGTVVMTGKKTLGLSSANLDTVAGAAGMTPFKSSFGATNIPGSGNYSAGAEFTFQDTGARAQMAFASTGTNATPELWLRSEQWSAASWSSWYEVLHTGNFVANTHYHPVPAFTSNPDFTTLDNFIGHLGASTTNAPNGTSRGYIRTESGGGSVYSLGMTNDDIRFGSNDYYVRHTGNFQAGVDYLAPGTLDRAVGDSSGATVFDRITVSDGLVTSVGTRELSPASIGAATDSHTHTSLARVDNRTVMPSEVSSNAIHAVFTSWDNDNSVPYADGLVLRSYGDSSGGADNMVTFKKSGIGMRIWQHTFGAATAFSSYETVATLESSAQTFTGANTFSGGTTRIGNGGYDLFINGGIMLRDYNNSALTNGKMYVEGDRFVFRGGGEGELDVTTNIELWVRSGGAERLVYHAGNFDPANYLLDTTDTLSGVLTITDTADVQLVLTSPSSWTGIQFNDSGANTGVIYHNGTNDTFAIGGGGSNVAGKKLHIDGGVSIGASLDGVSVPSNGLYIEGNIIVDNVSDQFGALVTARANGNSFEFGHENQAGYGSVLSSHSSNGRPHLIFHGSEGAAVNTFKTWGIKSSIVEGDGSGGIAFKTVATAATTDSQAGITTATISSAGALTATGNVTAAEFRVGDGTNGRFFTDVDGRTAYSSGQFYLQASVPVFYNYAAITYMGLSAGADTPTHFTNNTLDGDDWSISGSSGNFTTTGTVTTSAPAGTSAVHIDCETSWVSGTLYTPGLQWREDDGTIVAAARGYVDASGVNHLALGTGWLDQELILSPTQATFGGDIKIPTTKRLYFDGGSDTYIYESSSDELGFVVGGTTLLELDQDAGQVQIKNGYDLILETEQTGFAQVCSTKMLKVPLPGGAHYNNWTSSIVGAIEISFPAATYASDKMLTFWVDVYEYTTGRSFSMFIGGYIYQIEGSNEWVNESVVTISDTTSNDYTVRFGAEGSRHKIWIGELASDWAYPCVSVRDVQVHGSSIGVTDWVDDWDITIEATAFGSVDATHSNNLPAAATAATADTSTKVYVTNSDTGGTNYPLVWSDSTASGNRNLYQSSGWLNINRTAERVYTTNLDASNQIDIGTTTGGGGNLYIHSSTAGQYSKIHSTSNLHIDPPASGALYLNYYRGNGVTYFGSGASTTPASVSSGVFTGTRFVSNQATGTAPFTVASTTTVTNLNADFLDGIHATGFLRSDAADTKSGNTQFYSTTIAGGYASSAVEIREYNLLSTGGTTNDGEAPALTFHWGGRTQMQVALHSDGILHFRDGTTHTTYKNIRVGTLYCGETETVTATKIAAWDALETNVVQTTITGNAGTATKMTATHESDYGIHGGYGNSNSTGADWGANIWSMGTAYDGGHAGAGYNPGSYCVSWLRSGMAQYNSNAGEGVYISTQAAAVKIGLGHYGIWAAGKITAGGIMYATGGNSTEWNLGYDHSLASHAPVGADVTASNTCNSPNIVQTTVSGSSGSTTNITVAATTDTTCSVGLWNSPTGSQAPKSDAGLTYNASTNALVCSGNITAYSDIRVKENIQIINDAVSKIKQISGYTFDRTDSDSPRQTGIIAQELIEILPEAVTVPENSDDMMAVAYGNMAGLFVEAIKEQADEITEMKERLSALEAIVEKLI